MEFFDGNYYSKNGLSKQDEQILRVDLFFLHTNGKGPCDERMAELLLKGNQWNLQHALEHYFVMLPQLKTRYIEELKRNMLNLYKIKMVEPIASMLVELGKWNFQTAESLYFRYEERISQISERFTGDINVDAEILKELEIVIKKDQEEGRKRKKNNKKKKRRKYKKNKKKRKNMNKDQPSEGNNNANVTAILPPELSQCQIFINKAEILKLKSIYNPPSTSSPKPTSNHEQALPQPSPPSKLTPDEAVASPKPSQLSKSTSNNKITSTPSSNKPNPPSVAPTPSLKLIPDDEPIHSNPTSDEATTTISTPDPPLNPTSVIPTPSSKSISNNDPPLNILNVSSKPTSNKDVTLNIPTPSLNIPNPSLTLNPTSNKDETFITLNPLLNPSSKPTPKPTSVSHTPSKPKPIPNTSLQPQQSNANQSVLPPFTSISVASVNTQTTTTNDVALHASNTPSATPTSLLKPTPTNDVELHASNTPSNKPHPPLNVSYPPSASATLNLPLTPIKSIQDGSDEHWITKASLKASGDIIAPDSPQIKSPQQPKVAAQHRTNIIKNKNMNPMNKFGSSGGSINKNKVGTSNDPTKASPLAPKLHTYCNKNKNKGDASPFAPAPLVKPTLNKDVTLNTSQLPLNTPNLSVNIPNPPLNLTLNLTLNNDGDGIASNSLQTQPSQQSTDEILFRTSDGGIIASNSPPIPPPQQQTDEISFKTNGGDIIAANSPQFQQQKQPKSTAQHRINNIKNNNIITKRVKQPPERSKKLGKDGIDPRDRDKNRDRDKRQPSKSFNPPSNKSNPPSPKQHTYFNINKNIDDASTGLLSASSKVPKPHKYFNINNNKVGASTDTSNATLNPTVNPALSKDATLQPPSDPTLKPTLNTTSNPTSNPTLNSTVYPTLNPTIYPILNPTLNPALKPTPDYATTSHKPSPPSKPTADHVRTSIAPSPPSKPPERSKKLIKNDIDPRDKSKRDTVDKYDLDGNMDPRERDKINRKHDFDAGDWDPRDRDKNYAVADVLCDPLTGGLSDPRDRDKCGVGCDLLENVIGSATLYSVINLYLSAVGNLTFYVTAALATSTLNMLYKLNTDDVGCGSLGNLSGDTILYSVIILFLTAVGNLTFYVTAALTTKTLNLLYKIKTDEDFDIIYLFSMQISLETGGKNCRIGLK